MEAEHKYNATRDSDKAKEYEDFVLDITNRVYELMRREVRLEKARGVPVSLDGSHPW